MGVAPAPSSLAGTAEFLPPGTATHRSGARVLLLLAVAALGVHQVVNLAEPGDLYRAAVTFLVGWVLCVALVASRARDAGYSPAAAYLIIFGFFHGGLLLDFVLRGGAGLPGVESGWFLGGHAPVAAALASIGMIAFTIASDVVTGRAAPRPAPDPGSRESRVLGLLGLGVQVIGFAIFAGVIVATNGLAILVAGYGDYLAAAQGSGLLGYGILAMGAGPVLAIAAGGRARLLSWSLFAGYALVAFPLGLRGEVLFPLVAMLVVEVRRGRRFRPLWAVGGVLLTMTLIGVVRETRVNGVGALLNLSSLTSPLSAAAELGYSLRPTVMVLGWHGRGEPFRHGETLFVVPVRAFERLLGAGPPGFDDRPFNTEILARVGPIGGSPVAEAYHNFGLAGVVVGMAVIGTVIGLLTRLTRTPGNDALLGALLMVLLIQVRNSFAPVPLQVALILVLLGAARLLGRPGAGSPPETRRVA